MPVYEAGLNIMANALATNGTHAAIHTADPTAAGSNQSAAARQPIAWNTAANGDIDLTVAENFTGGAASGAATWVGVWTALTGGTILAAFALTGDQTFNAAGEYTLNDITINGSSA